MAMDGSLVPKTFHLQLHLVHCHCYNATRLHVIDYLNGDFFNFHEFLLWLTLELLTA